MSSKNNYAEDTPFLFKLLRTPAFRFIVVDHNYYGFVRQIREDLQTRYPDRPIHSMDAEKADFRAFSDAYDTLDSGFFLIENFEQILKPTDQVDLQARRNSLIKGINRTRDRLALKPIALIVFMLHSEQERYMYRLMRAMPDMWSFRSFILELHQQHEAQSPNLRMTDTATRSVHISTLGGNTQEEKLQELERLQKSLINMTDIASLKTTYKQIAQIQQDVGHYLNAVQTWQKVQDIEDDSFERNNICGKQGDLYRIVGDLTQALRSYQKALKCVEENSRQHGIILERIGNIYSDLGELDKALQCFEKYNKLLISLLEKDNEDYDIKNLLAISYYKLGTIHSDMGNPNEALVLFDLRNKLSKQLYEAYPQNVELANGLAISYERLGSTYSNLGYVDKALPLLEMRSELAKQLHEAYPQNTEFKNSLAISYQKLGETHTLLDNIDKALSFFGQYSKLEEQLYKAYPQNVEFKSNLAVSYAKLGNTHTYLNNLDKAISYFEESKTLYKQLYQVHSQNVSLKNGLAVSYGKLGIFYKSKLKSNRKAKVYLQKAHDLWQELTNAYPAYAEFQTNLKNVKSYLEDM